MKFRKIMLSVGLVLGLFGGCSKPSTNTSTSANPDNPNPTCSDEEVVCNQASYIFVDGTNGKDTNDGSLKTPVQTIRQGVELAAANQKKAVIITSGNYIENIFLTNGISLYGQYDAQNGWKKSTTANTTIRNASLESYAGIDASFGLKGQDIVSPTTLSNLNIIAKDANNTTGNGSHSIGLHCVHCPGLIMDNLNVSSANAGMGIEWAANLDGQSGENGQNGISSTCSLPTGPSGGTAGRGLNSNSGGRGGVGGNSNPPSVGGNGEYGYPSPQLSGGKGATIPGVNGENGANGDNGLDGTHGQANPSAILINNMWITNNGGDATDGLNGNGGGGGGGSAGVYSFIRIFEGNSGGGGGAGGNAGKGGRGGSSGGNSIGVFLINSSSAKVTGLNTFVSGNGANGRLGQVGGKGSIGGRGGQGGSTSTCRTTQMGLGGNGGDGGSGGNGGSGAGGNGGSSIALLLANTILNDGSDFKNYIQTNTGKAGQGAPSAISLNSLPAEAGVTGESKDILILNELLVSKNNLVKPSK